MSRIFSLTLIRTSTSAATIFSNPFANRRISFQAGNISYIDASSTSDAIVAEKIDDAIYGLVVQRFKPYWLPFVPGSSYWVPPRQSSYGAAEIINQLKNPMNGDQQMSVMSLQGWPSSAFYADNGPLSQDDTVEGPSQDDTVEGELTVSISSTSDDRSFNDDIC